VCKCSGDDVTKVTNVAHMEATHIWIKRESPARRSVCLLLRTKNAHKVLVIERRHDERIIRKLCFLDHPINLGPAGKSWNVELAAADRFYIRQR